MSCASKTGDGNRVGHFPGHPCVSCTGTILSALQPFCVRQLLPPSIVGAMALKEVAQALGPFVPILLRFPAAPTFSSATIVYRLVKPIVISAIFTIATSALAAFSLAGLLCRDEKWVKAPCTLRHLSNLIQVGRVQPKSGGGK